MAFGSMATDAEIVVPEIVPDDATDVHPTDVAPLIDPLKTSEPLVVTPVVVIPAAPSMVFEFKFKL